MRGAWRAAAAGYSRPARTHVQADQVAAGALQSHQPQQAAAVRHTRQAGLLAADIRALVSGRFGDVRGGGGLSPPSEEGGGLVCAKRHESGMR